MAFIPSFSPRAQNLARYMMDGFDLKVLSELIAKSVRQSKAATK
jgi:hypothetical protein